MGLVHSLRRLLGTSARRPGHSWPTLAQPGFPIALSCSLAGDCTAAVEWFLHHCGMLDEARAGGETAEEFVSRRLLGSSRYARLSTRVIARRDCHVVKVVRDPFRRAVDLHILSIAPAPVAAEHDGLGRRNAAELRRWRAALVAGRDTDSSLREFLLLVAEERRCLRPLAPHVAPQYDPTLDPRVDEFLAAEDLAAGLTSLEDRFRLPRSPLARFAGQWRPQPIENSLDKQTRALVELAYDCDCAAYGGLYGIRAGAAAPDPLRTSLWADIPPPARPAGAAPASRARAA